MTATATATVTKLDTKSGDLAPKPVLNQRPAIWHCTPATKSRRPDNLVWFELPVNDLVRAIAFYEALFATELRIDPRFPELAIFPRQSDDSITGALISDGVHQPSDRGAIVYLNCDGEIDRILGRVTALGGSVLQEVAQLPGGLGWIAQIGDLDGNRVGLHAIF